MPHSVATDFYPALIHAWPATKADKHPFMRAQHDANVARPRLPLPPIPLALPNLAPLAAGPVTPPSDMMKLPRTAALATEGYPFTTAAAAAATVAFDEGYMSSSNPKSFGFPVAAQVRGSSDRSTISPANPAAKKTWQSPSKVLAANPGLKIPHTVLAPQADLPELAAEVTCLFWFENGSIDNLGADVLRISAPSSLSPHVLPSAGFRKWVETLLVTTQVTQNVILLALLFIYRLKMMNNAARGGFGSEYRLLTVALMLGNKFLDDNTYTNKTWADVSGISIQEIHVMEVEFLSNMRYTLFVTNAAWKNWHAKLGQFATFARQIKRSLGLRSTEPHESTLTSPISPSFAAPNFTLPQAGSPRTMTPVLAPQVTSAAISPMGPLPELASRKRAFDDELSEPPAKRILTSYANQRPVAVMSLPSMRNPVLAQRLPLPSLAIPAVSTLSTHIQQITPTSLPAPGGRAMGLVYPNYPLQSVAAPATNFSVSSNNSSPISATAYPSHLSPSFFLAQRASPYRPVRRVQTLLVPGHNILPPTVGWQNSMQYHSLGQPLTERHFGHVPYMNHEAWPQQHQPNQWPQQVLQMQLQAPSSAPGPNL